MTHKRFTPPRWLTSLVKDERGTTVIETAIVAPVLVAMALGSYDVSQMIARQHELQSGASDVEAIVFAVSTGTATDTVKIKQVLMASLGLTTSQVVVAKVYRCGTTTALVTSSSSCATGSKVSTYVQVSFTDRYSPIWTDFGVGAPLDYNVVRTVQVG
jgi:Flp pilus assembly protein TadG